MKIEEVNLTKDDLIKIEEIDNTFYKDIMKIIKLYYFLTMINVWVIVFMFQ